MSNNLVDPEFQKIAKELAKGKFPGPLAVKQYKHPIKDRKKVVSKGQVRDTRRSRK
jgi:hypothetical protein